MASLDIQRAMAMVREYSADNGDNISFRDLAAYLLSTPAERKWGFFLCEP